MRIMLLAPFYCMLVVPLAILFLLLGYFVRRIRWSAVEILVIFAPLCFYAVLDLTGVVPFSVSDPASLEDLRDWQARGDFTKGYTPMLDMLICGFFAGLIPLPRVLAGGSRTWTWAGASIVILIALALYLMTPAVYSP